MGPGKERDGSVVVSFRGVAMVRDGAWTADSLKLPLSQLSQSLYSISV